MSTLCALAVGFILVTICWTVILLQEIKDRRSRFLVGMVGIISVFHGLRLLTDPGLAGFEGAREYGHLVDLLVAILVFVALLILNNETARHRVTQVKLRLSEAMEPPAPVLDKKAISQVFARRQAAKDPVDGGSERPEAVLDRLIQRSPIAIVALDDQGRVCTCNRAAEELYGVNERALLGQPLPPVPAKDESGEKATQRLRAAEAHS